MKNTAVKNLALAALFMAIGLVLPFLTGQIPQVGNMMLPMHIPVFLCGLICGWKYGAAVGFILPPLRYFLFSMPPLFPTGTAMAFELLTYGLVVGLLYGRSRWQCILSLYRSMAVAMITGRIVWGIAQIFLLLANNKAFTWQLFISGAFLNAIPGIILQFILIPAIMVALKRTGLIHSHKKHSKCSDEITGN